uniref:Uncharacterized protein n=1 Tax=Physcomitrium patens TaxID=3218 RepID=A0A2K1JRU1_PHYPA|nr:hypothetical protein PHYPA_016635 [Physcomitrium patens]
MDVKGEMDVEGGMDVKRGDVCYLIEGWMSKKEMYVIWWKRWMLKEGWMLKKK